MFTIIVLISALLSAPTHAQPAHCLDDTQCPEGSYCATEAALCVKCFSCEDFSRNLGPENRCIKTVGECGPCLDGLVADQTLHCFPPVEETDGMPTYAWAIIIGILVLVAFIIVVVFIYLFRGNVFKISSRTRLHGPSPHDVNGSLSVHASAPDPPPPYNPYSMLRPDSPPAHVPHDEMPYMDTRDEDADTAGPFIKRAPSSGGSRAQPREADGSQNARVYNKPAYMRHRSPSPESKFEDDDNFSPIQDEDTTESTWTPADSNNINGNTSSNETSIVRASRTTGPDAGAEGGAGAGAGAGEASSLPALLAAARDTTLLEPPAKKAKEHVNDSNNNGNPGAVTAEGNTTNTSHQNAQAAAMYLNIQVNNYPRNVLHYN